MLLVPLLYFIITITQIQGASYAAAGAADQAAKVFVRATTERDAYEAMEQAIGLTLSDHGLPREAAVFTVMCEPEECHLSGTAVTVEIRVDVPLPFTPAGLGLDAAHLVARSTQTMSRP
ncbi:hypothetical protein [Arthrobacter sp. NPDC090010]|uniref:hypothetical protein n=1 Tax=Arthrobacter sp. NPDC090010 TaxID=3363942 RepID=UPI003803678E